MPELAEDSINWFEMKGIAVRLQGRIVLEKIDWDFGKKEHWAILGGNGAGKSTILRVLAQQIPYCEGTLRRNPELQGVTNLGWVHLNQPMGLLAQEKLKDDGRSIVEGSKSNKPLEACSLRICLLKREVRTCFALCNWIQK